MTLRGRNVSMSDAVRESVQRKLGRLDRYLDRIREVRVEIARQDTRSAEHRFTVEVTVDADGDILRGEEHGPTIAAALDQVADVLQKRLVRYKERLKTKPRSAAAAVPDEPASEAPAEEEPKVVRIKRLAVKPISAEDAIEQMEQVGHSFLVFINDADERVNVVYRRRDGNYGLIVPDQR